MGLNLSEILRVPLEGPKEEIKRSFVLPDIAQRAANYQETQEMPPTDPDRRVKEQKPGFLSASYLKETRTCRRMFKYAEVWRGEKNTSLRKFRNPQPAWSIRGKRKKEREEWKKRKAAQGSLIRETKYPEHGCYSEYSTTTIFINQPPRIVRKIVSLNHPYLPPPKINFPFSGIKIHPVF